MCRRMVVRQRIRTGGLARRGLSLQELVLPLLQEEGFPVVDVLHDVDVIVEEDADAFPQDLDMLS